MTLWRHVQNISISENKVQNRDPFGVSNQNSRGYVCAWRLRDICAAECVTFFSGRKFEQSNSGAFGGEELWEKSGGKGFTFH